MKSFTEEFSQIVSETKNSKYSNQMHAIKQLSNNRPVILYGAGKAVGIALVICSTVGLDITALCDSNKTGKYEIADVALPIISPKELLDKYSDALLIITSWRYENEIRGNLIQTGFNPESIFSLWFPQRVSLDIFKRDFLSGYEWAYNFYEDEKSKQLVLDRARSYLTSQPIAPNTDCKAYYEPEFVFTDKEVFLDGGAFDGDSIKDFIHKVNGNYEYIYAFEPNPINFKKLHEFAKDIVFAKLIEVGLGEAIGDELLYFNGLVDSGFAPVKYFISNGDKFSDTKFDTEMKSVVTIDSCFGSNLSYLLPTFIKLDVEGYEAEALCGASATIKKAKPKLAICVYHKVDDIYVIPQTILNIRDDYKFKLRQCDYGYYETVLYAY